MTTALVLGGANNVWTDVEKALRLGEFDGVVACNDVVAHWSGTLSAAVSLHSEKWPLWLRQRMLNGHSAPERVYGHLEFQHSTLRKSPNYVTHFEEYKFPGQKDSGSSGLFALKVALELFDQAVVCGMPMTNEGRHFFNKRPWGGAANHRRGWLQAKQHLGEARSMSGWTAELLGRPTQGWLAHVESKHQPAI